MNMGDDFAFKRPIPDWMVDGGVTLPAVCVYFIVVGTWNVRSTLSEF